MSGGYGCVENRTFFQNIAGLLQLASWMELSNFKYKCTLIFAPNGGCVYQGKYLQLTIKFSGGWVKLELEKGLGKRCKKNKLQSHMGWC